MWIGLNLSCRSCWQLKGANSALQTSSSSPRCFKTWHQPNEGGKVPDQTCILATLSIPANLGSSWSTLQPSLVNLTTLVNLWALASSGEPWWTLVSLSKLWWTLEHLGSQPGCSIVASLWRRSERRATRSIPWKIDGLRHSSVYHLKKCQINISAPTSEAKLHELLYRP